MANVGLERESPIRGRVLKLCMYHTNCTTTFGRLVYNLLLLIHMRPANQPTTTGVAFCHKTFTELLLHEPAGNWHSRRDTFKT